MHHCPIYPVLLFFLLRSVTLLRYAPKDDYIIVLIMQMHACDSDVRGRGIVCHYFLIFFIVLNN